MRLWTSPNSRLRKSEFALHSNASYHGKGRGISCKLISFRKIYSEHKELDLVDTLGNFKTKRETARKEKLFIKCMWHQLVRHSGPILTTKPRAKKMDY